MPILLIFAPFILGIKKRWFSHPEEMKTVFLNSCINFILLPYKATILIKSIFTSLYRLLISKKHLLDWVTAADAEKSLKNTPKSYAKDMIIAPLLGFLLIITTFFYNNITFIEANILFWIWYVSPFIAYYISSSGRFTKKKVKILKDVQKENLIEIANRTWNFFDTYLTKENNFLMPDNYDESRKNIVTNHTSSTNIGLSIVSLISAFNLGFISEDECITKLENIFETIDKLKKWNGHLYNWYNIKTLDTIKPEFISTVDSGNFIGYLYVTIGFLENLNNEEKIKNLKTKIKKIINETDFSKLYDYDKNIFSIGFDIGENKLVDSYYDLMASEARLASFVAIAKSDVPYKHWFYLGRSYTKLNRENGLVSWSGTMFEYLMPNMIMKVYENSMLESASEFAIYSQIKYAEKLDIPWGISESAFNVKDLKYNYQYKAFGIPWLGLKRGLEDEIVVSPYSSIMAILSELERVLDNIDYLKEYGSYGKFGFYESIDFTPGRVKNNKFEIVKTYMAHHQGLILLALNNVINKNILKKYFSQNVEVSATEILLQEKKQDYPNYIKTKKENIKKLKYKDYEDFGIEVINNGDENVNIQNNDMHTLLIDTSGKGYSKINNLYLYKYNENQKFGNITYIKNVSENEFWSSSKGPCIKEPDEYEVEFSNSESFFYRKDGNIETYTTIVISPEDNVEIRKVELRNISEKDSIINLVNYYDPVISDINTDIVHPAYNKLFMSVQNFNNNIIVEKRYRSGDKKYLASFAISEDSNVRFEYETDKAEIIGRCRNIANPVIMTENKIFSNNISENTDLGVATKAQFILKGNSSIEFYFCIGFGEELDEIKNVIDKYKNIDMINRTFEMARTRAVIENRFYGLNQKQISTYKKLLFEIINGSNTRNKYLNIINQNEKCQKDFWKYGISGDLPIILIKIKNINDVYMVREVIDAIKYFRLKNIFVDLIIIDEEKDEKYIYDNILRYVELKGISYLLGANGGIHVLFKENISFGDKCLFYSSADVIMESENGFLKEQLGGENEKL